MPTSPDRPSTRQRANSASSTARSSSRPSKPSSPRSGAATSTRPSIFTRSSRRLRPSDAERGHHPSWSAARPRLALPRPERAGEPPQGDLRPLFVVSGPAPIGWFPARAGLRIVVEVGLLRRPSRDRTSNEPRMARLTTPFSQATGSPAPQPPPRPPSPPPPHPPPPLPPPAPAAPPPPAP